LQQFVSSLPYKTISQSDFSLETDSYLLINDRFPFENMFTAHLKSIYDNNYISDIFLDQIHMIKMNSLNWKIWANHVWMLFPSSKDVWHLILRMFRWLTLINGWFPDFWKRRQNSVSIHTYNKYLQWQIFMSSRVDSYWLVHL
jgi:hypothetical protein